MGTTYKPSTTYKPTTTVQTTTYKPSTTVQTTTVVTSTVQTTTEPTTTVQTTTYVTSTVPTTTVQTTTVQTTTVQTTTVQTTTVYETTAGVTDCTIDGFEADDNGICYKCVYAKLNWIKAAKACKALGNAVLATVPDKVANNFIKDKLNGNSWIGATDQTKEGTWKWLNGDSMSYTNWKNSNDIKNKDGDCAYMYSSSGKWQDEECSKKLQFCCMEK